MIWTIRPGQGLGPLDLGMTPEAVAEVPGLGRAGHVYRGTGGRTMEYRGLHLPICEYREGQLVRIVTGRHVAGVQFAGVDLFAVETAVMLRLLESRLGPVTLCTEQLFFGTAGLCLSGFYDMHDHQFFKPGVEYHDERSLALFAPGQSGGEGEDHEPISFL
ncbi:hypothetical protein [Rhodovulum adriaticum]|uniref:Uncharacterized protein n=1 Tax=Rhodovulum adriaticum TaxID=35804 RepID=A0A4R2NML7_RHOAD|nr:hypothetical protein [Rhodovulum adriaticum]MBK1636371.1 hypothetical protein [Rhodovulum adriaticum]TCP22860.1 hypothetical protein EV656_105162 [Rhodovulum adriaticum]